jgi:hypothetical protein
MPTPIKKQRKPRIPPLTIENAHIVYRNFSGAAKQFNAKGLRNFHVVLEPDQAKELEKVGWNIKWPKPRDDGEERNPTIKVAVRFDNYPPYILQLTSRGRVELDEESINNLDMAEFENVDLKITGSWYETPERSGFKAYLSQMFVTLSENDLLGKYSRMSPARHQASEEDAD